MLAVSVDAFNQSRAELVVVIPITSTLRPIPFHVVVQPPEGGLTNPSALLCEAVRSIRSPAGTQSPRPPCPKSRTGCEFCCACKTHAKLPASARVMVCVFCKIRNTRHTKSNRTGGERVEIRRDCWSPVPGYFRVPWPRSGHPSGQWDVRRPRARRGWSRHKTTSPP